MKRCGRYIYRCTNQNNCYEINGGKNNTNCYYSYDIEQCNNCYFSIGLTGCDSCILCSNIANKKFCIKNIQYSKEEFEEQLKAMNYKEYIEERKTLLKSSLKVSVKNYQSEKTIGNGNMNGNNLIMCSNLIEGTDCRYCEEGAAGLINCIDGNYGYSSTMCYESLSISLGSSSMCTVFTIETQNSLYCINTFNCKNCFGCVGLRNVQYCIFNTQYTKEEYELTVSKIISHMQETGERGEFFHQSLSPFGHNETIANEYLPLSKEEARAKGYKRQDNNYDSAIPEGAKVIDRTITTEELINVDDIIKSIFICEVSGRPYRIIKQELEFYRKHNLSLPRKHPDIRHEERVKIRPGRTLYLRTCDKTGEEMLSVYPSDCPGKVYSEKAYQAEVYG